MTTNDEREWRDAREHLEPDRHDRDRDGICRRCGEGMTARDILDGEQPCNARKHPEPEWEYGTRKNVVDGWESGERYGEHEGGRVSKEKIEVGDWVLTSDQVRKKYDKQVLRVHHLDGDDVYLTPPGGEGNSWYFDISEVTRVDRPSTHVVDTSSTFADLVTQKLTAIADLLVEKNRKYGDSALNPANVFSKASAVEALKVRIDDKIKRIRQGETDDTEDSVTDLIGYLILLQIATEGAK